MGLNEYRKDHIPGNTIMSFFARVSLLSVSASNALPNLRVLLPLAVVVAVVVKVKGVADMIFAMVEPSASLSFYSLVSIRENDTEQGAQAQQLLLESRSRWENSRPIVPVGNFDIAVDITITSTKIDVQPCSHV
jgi:hypothetical protein